MDKGQNVDSPRMHLDQREGTKSHSDMMIRRLKNRERQRRYRARKRLEAGFKEEASVINPPTPKYIESGFNEISFTNPPKQANETLSNFMTRIYCKRDWKKDARSAHTSKQAVTSSSNAQTIGSGSQTPCLALGIRAEPPPESEGFHSNPETAVGTASGRRHWKADARNKKWLLDGHCTDKT